MQLNKKRTLQLAFESLDAIKTKQSILNTKINKSNFKYKVYCVFVADFN